MAGINLTKALREEYDRLFLACKIRSDRKQSVDRAAQKLVDNQARYQQVAAAVGMPWYVIAVIHNMESSQNFERHMHNGDPLTARTRQVPANRPRSGQPPFTWEQSADDALRLKRLHLRRDWSLPATLYVLEAYNGWGYRKYHPHVLSPYLWCFSEHYRSGKYVADGRWSETAASRQCGAATLLRRLAENGHIQFPDQAIESDDTRPLVAAYATRKPRTQEAIRQAEGLQNWLNTHDGIFLLVDGHAGKKTSDAYRLVTGHLLPGDPRA